jgi:hypothetical protein
MINFSDIGRTKVPKQLVLDASVETPAGVVELDRIILADNFPFDLNATAHRAIRIPVRVKVLGIPVKMRISADVFVTLKTLAYPEDRGPGN